MMSSLPSLYRLRYPAILVYMLQNTEYQIGPYLQWYWRTQDFSRVEHRRRLVYTRPARLLLLIIVIGILAQIGLGLGLIWLWWRGALPGGWAFGLALILAYPVVWAHLIVLPLIAGRLLVVLPRQRRQIAVSEQIFQRHPGEKIAIVGSYGKTSMKELLLTVLSAGKKVAATPANLNVAVSHAAFARQLEGDEDILLIEYGEGAPGDVARFARTTHPTRAVITGVAAAHLDKYKSTHDAGKDIFSVAGYLSDKSRCYVNNDCAACDTFIRGQAFQGYSHEGALGWKVRDVSVNIHGLEFTLVKAQRRIRVRSGLLGRHNIGPLSLAAGLAAEFGIGIRQIEAAVAGTLPFEHRMQPYQLNGAWIIDDTYNGNIEGIKAGTALLKELPARRKLYVTPGLVDQGAETKAVHRSMGQYIAAAEPDKVILMKNSATEFIAAGLTQAGYKGEVVVESDPLGFYSNIDKYIAAGDLVMMQNEWPDNYA